MSKILITGDCGFVGMNLIDSFAENEPDTEIIGLSKKTIASNSRIKNYTHYDVDINDVYTLYATLDKVNPDLIIHLAAEADVGRSYLYPFDFLKVNLIGSFNLLEWLRHNIGTKVIFFSTDEVFLNLSNAPSKETDKFMPENPYSASKAATECYIEAYRKAFDVDAMIVRPFNIMGVYQKPNRLISKIITTALADKPLTLFADTGKHKRGWIYSKNIYHALKLLREKGNFRESYNLKYDGYCSVDEIKDMILKKLGKEHLFKGYAETARPKDDYAYLLDSSKIEALGYKPRYKFDEGLSETIMWYKENLKR
ncbi:MAG: dTDP-glucose 4,6-dehydratase [Candidatus Micrarchaeaceae archaeon]